MNQPLNPEDWPSIRYENELLPQSISGISILINCPLTERTADWIWRFCHCKGVWKNGEAQWCIDSVIEILGYIEEYRFEIISEIKERLEPHGFNAETTITEWREALKLIKKLSDLVDGDCQWISSEPEDLEEKSHRFSTFIGTLE